MMPVTVFTFGDPDPDTAERIGDVIVELLPGAVTQLGRSSGTGNWSGSIETCGSLVVAGLALGAAVRIASAVAEVFDQDAVGVVHNETGATLAVPGCGHLAPAEEVFGP